MNVSVDLDNSKSLVKDQASEIVDLKNTVDGLKGSLNLARAETRAYIETNSVETEHFQLKSNHGVGTIHETMSKKETDVDVDT